MASHGTVSNVFIEFYYGGTWPTLGLSFMVGLIGLVFAFVSKSLPTPEFNFSKTQS